MSSKTRLNYALDVVIALAFILSAVSGAVLLFAGAGGYQGGRNPDFQAEILSISRTSWKDLHSFAGLAMIAGVLVHLVFHWDWIVCTTRRLLKPTRRQAQEACPVE
jgi:cytochrome b subunit of formate dehydrogenase